MKVGAGLKVTMKIKKGRGVYLSNRLKYSREQ